MAYGLISGFGVLGISQIQDRGKWVPVSFWLFPVELLGHAAS
ncbi:MAG: hypothetical protein U5J95_03525 [Balneolaceae bacterium]|nr:hypothetical protein [Balneolaceae bacterium]